jgi:pyruvate/2-oxoglutarate/acetoin dehydrogenase E1 component
MDNLTYLQSLQQGLHKAFELNGRVHLLGEDILDPYGGAFKVSAGLSTKFPGRVWTTPISEAALVGLSSGMAIRGLLPVVEIMFGDFLCLGADQIINHATKFAAMYNGRVKVPAVIRTPVGGGRGYGPTHSQSIEKLFFGVPYLTVVAPSLAHNPGELLQHAILNDDRVVLFLEHKLLYPMKLLQPSENLRLGQIAEQNGYPTVTVENYSEGDPDVTLIGYGGISRLCLPVLDYLASEEVRVLAVFPSCLKPLPMDTLAELSKRSGRVVIAEEGTMGFNWGSELSALLYERMWRQLEAPIRRVASRDSILPTAREMEDQVLVTSEKIQAAILEAMA